MKLGTSILILVLTKRHSSLYIISKPTYKVFCPSLVKQYYDTFLYHLYYCLLVSNNIGNNMVAFSAHLITQCRFDF